MAKNYKPKPFEAIQGVPNKMNTSANLYATMLQSEAFKSLSHRQVRLYLYMKAQYYGALAVEGSQDCFYFNRAMWSEKGYGLYTNQNSFYEDVKALISKGFIEIGESGRFTRKKNIYKYSDKWATWKDDS
ncbi:hypothetical protein M2150_001306 [Lachnospiraceae bacterium PM6-15]|uniref:hypothetical protein n=1 Tax=Ohessyouella blattaphilus TaxID=2949333 RepID=UPI003E192097